MIMKSPTKTEGLVKIAMGYNEGRSVVAPLYLTGLLACLLTGCVNKAQQNFDRPPAPVTVTVAISQDVPTYLDAIGKTVAPEVAYIQPQSSGGLKKIHFSNSADVNQNDRRF